MSELASPQEEQCNTCYQRGERNPLRIGEAEVQALLVIAEEFDDESRDAVEHHIEADYCAGAVRAGSSAP